MTDLKTLSKSQYMKGHQCALALWLSVNKPELKPEIDPSAQARFDSWNEVGLLARECFPQGKAINTLDMIDAISLTNEALKTDAKVIYEAAATNPRTGTQARIDILKKADGTDQWDLIEVKSSTSVKDAHIQDMAFQYLVFKGAGYKIRSCLIVTINNEYVRNGEINPLELFTVNDVTGRIEDEYSTTEAIADELFTILEQKKQPRMMIGDHCSRPYECDYKKECWKHIPEYSLFNVFNTDRAIKIAQQIKSYQVEDLPNHFIPAGAKGIDVFMYQENTTHADTRKIGEFLDKLQYPLYYLDYETISSAIPLFDGTKPYQQIPFQFSLHVQKEPNGEVEHFEFIHKEKKDPRPSLIDSLISLCGQDGSVVCYNAAFEMTCNKQMAAILPQYAEQLLAINARTIDLLVPFKGRALYHPKQMGSASIKYVLPAFTDLSYDSLNIANGQEAVDAYTQFVKGSLSEQQTNQLWQDLSVYCELDTYAMVELVRVLFKHQ